MVEKLDIDKTQHDFQFTRNWFRNRNLRTFQERVHPAWAGKPINYLELGVFEGMSMVWMMQRVLTHNDSQAVGIDPWLMTTKLDNHQMEMVMQRAQHNMIPWQDRCQLMRGNSAEVLRRMCVVKNKGYLGISPGIVDISMIDGNHNSLAVLDDSRLVFELLKPGGWMLFDDVENKIPKTDHVKKGVELFLGEAKDKVHLLWKHRFMVCFAKK